MSDTFLPGSGFDTYESQDKVLMQMDGSTEAAVAVRILQQQGFAVVGAVVRLAPEQAEAAQRAKKAAEALGIECILLNAEALAQQPEAAGAWPQFAALLTAADKLGIQYCDVYGLSEIMGPGVAMECAERGGLHIAEDQFYCEIIDPETLEVLPDGEVGELVITTLTRECSPMIRYRTRDVTTINAEPCACGRTHRKIDRIIGRSDDMMIIRGVNVFPQQIEQIITGFDEITAHYQIVLTDNGPLDKVTLNVETVPEFPIDEIRKLEDLKARLGAELKSNLQIKVDIKIVEPKSIERSEGKAKRVIDLREGKH